MNKKFADKVFRVLMIFAFVMGWMPTTSAGAQEPNPFFIVRIDENLIESFDWTKGVPITLTIDDPSTSETADYTQTITFPLEYSNKFRFNLGSFIIQPGFIVAMTDGTITRTHTILNLKVDGVDTETEVVFGKAEPGTFVHVFACDESGCGSVGAVRHVFSNENGNWTADFSNYGFGGDEQSLFDIKAGKRGEAFQSEYGDVNSTSWSWSVPNPTLRVNPNGVWGVGWPLGASITLTIDDPANGVGTDYTATETVQLPNWANQPTVVFNLDPNFIKVGFGLIMTDGVTTKIYTVLKLVILDINFITDTIYGEAKPEGEVNIWMEGAERVVMADADGNWIADFSIPGSNLGENSFDILPGTSVMANIQDEDGDGTGDWAEAMKPPVFMLNVNNDSSWGGLDAWNWQLDSQVTLTVDDPGTPQNPDYTEAQTMERGNDSYHATRAMYMQNNEFSGHPGFTITLSDGVQTKTMVVPLLAITGYDIVNDTITGVSDPFAIIQVPISHTYGPDWVEPTAVADSEGNWLVDFAGTFDLQLGDTAEPQIYDDDWDHIVLRDWQVSPGQPPQCQPGDTVTGTVFEHDGVTPVLFAEIQIEDYNTGEIRFTSTADQNGTFACHLPNGDYRILAWTENSTHTQEYYNEATDVNATTLHITTGAQFANINFTLSPAPAIEFFTFNLQNLLLQDLAVRQAISFGTDRQRILNEAFLPNSIYGMVTNSIVVPEHWASAPASELHLYPFDPADARAILEAAGWVDRDSDGFRENADGAELAFTFKTRNSPFRMASGAIFQQNMADIGIRIATEYLPNLQEITVQRNFDIAEFAWAGCKDNEPCLGEYVTGSQYNYAGYSNSAYDIAIANARNTEGDSGKLPYLIEAQRILTNDLPILPLFTRYEVTPVTTPVGTNITVSPESYLDIHFGDITQEGVTSVLATSLIPSELTPNFKLLGHVYDIGTNASFTNARVCFTYDAVGLSLAQETAIRLFHLENNIWTDVTDTGYPDTASHIVCGTVSSFSPFAVMYPSDITPPIITWVGDISNGNNYYFGFVPAEPTCTANDLSGVDGPCAVTGYASTIGVHTLTATATDIADNVATETRSYIVLPWTLRGFYQPVDMNGVYNLVKGGSTVPLKFEIFAGSTELTDITEIKSFTYAQITCDANVITDEIELTATGSTSLRYADGQFIYNWKTPKTVGKCYRVTMTAFDDSTLTAYFKLK